MTATRGTRPSWAWTTLLKGRELLQRGTRWQIHNGQSVNFWEDKWIPSVPCFQISTIKPPRTLIHVVEDAIDPTYKCWKMEVLQQFVTPEEIQAISLIPISMENKQDVVEWHPSKFGIFSVKSGYALARALQDQQQQNCPSTSFQLPHSFWKQIWHLDVPPKLKHFWWKTCNNFLATKANLLKRNCSASGMCPICLLDLEIVEHLFFDCPWTQLVWFGSQPNLRVGRGMVSNLTVWLSQQLALLASSPSWRLFLSQLIMTAW